MVFKKASEVSRRKKVAEANKLRGVKNRERKTLLSKQVVKIGRRVLDLTLIAQTMWCEKCDIGLSFRHLLEERQIGVASEYKIRCHRCLQVYNISSSSTVANTSTHRPLYSINCKLAAGRYFIIFGDVSWCTHGISPRRTHV